MNITSSRSVYVLLVLVMMLWSGNSIVARAIHEDVPPFTLSFIRWTGATLIAVPFAWRGLMADRALIASKWPIILFLGALGAGSFGAFFFSGLQYTTATNSLLIQAAIPALVLLFNGLIFRARPRGVQVVGVIVAALGVVAIVFKGDVAALIAMDFGKGDALIVCAVCIWALYTVLLSVRPPLSGLSFLALTAFVGALVMAPLSLFELRSHAVHLTPGVIAGIAYVTICPSILAYFLYDLAVRSIGAPQAGQALNLQPLFGALLAIVILGEPLHGYHVLGMALILGGIALPFVARRSPAPVG